MAQIRRIPNKKNMNLLGLLKKNSTELGNQAKLEILRLFCSLKKIPKKTTFSWILFGKDCDEFLQICRRDCWWKQSWTRWSTFGIYPTDSSHDPWYIIEWIWRLHILQPLRKGYIFLTIPKRSPAELLGTCFFDENNPKFNRQKPLKAMILGRRFKGLFSGANC